MHRRVTAPSGVTLRSLRLNPTPAIQPSIRSLETSRRPPHTGCSATHRDGKSPHRPEDARKVAPLVGEQIPYGALALLLRLREQHAAHLHKSAVLHEHVLRAHQPKTLRAKRT